MKRRGKVCLVGAGPGDPELLTLKAVRMLQSADVVLYDRLVSDEVLAMVPPGTRMIPVGKAPGCHPMPQERISQLLVELAVQGRTVIRLKGGDPFIFGRGAEEAAVLQAQGVPVEIVPGITSAQGAAAVTGVPLTHRGLATGIRYVAGHCRNDLPLTLDWAGLADPATTLVIYMGAGQITEISARLIDHGLPGETPVLAVSRATMPGEQRLLSRLDALAVDLAQAEFRSPVLIIVGQVVSLYRASPEAIRTGIAAELPPEAVHA